MKQKTIDKKEDVYYDNCAICNQEITGYSEVQVNSRMDMHKRKHKVR